LTAERVDFRVRREKSGRDRSRAALKTMLGRADLLSRSREADGFGTSVAIESFSGSPRARALRAKRLERNARYDIRSCIAVPDNGVTPQACNARAIIEIPISARDSARADPETLLIPSSIGSGRFGADVETRKRRTTRSLHRAARHRSRESLNVCQRGRVRGGLRRGLGQTPSQRLRSNG